MAIKDANGNVTFDGVCLKVTEKYWLDGMLEEYMTVWDMEEHTSKTMTVGYYGIDGNNMCGTTYDVDCTEDVARDIIKTLREWARAAFAADVARYKKEIHKGDVAEVIRGRKVKKGTKLNVFWVGERETYKSRQYNWMYETEEIAGAYTEDGEKVWIKTEYLKNITPYKPVKPKERKRFISSYIERRAKEYGIVCAR